MESSSGLGSTFSFTVPMAAGAALPAPAWTDDGLDPLTGRRVLVLEDDPSAADALQGLLRTWGCEVRAAADTEEALSIVRGGFRPEAVVADLRLGRGDDGIQAITRLQAEIAAQAEAAGGPVAPRLPALLVTGDAVAPRSRALVEAGGVVLRKPVKPSRLRAWLQGVLSLSA